MLRFSNALEAVHKSWLSFQTMTTKMMSLVLLVLIGVTHSLDNGLARTPPMGWMSWQRFRCNIDCKDDKYNCISEDLYMEMADHLVSDGYRDLGYEYVNIDDCWAAKQRDSDGKLRADPERFPSGIKKLADYVHSKGLKLGIYGDFGTLTCGGYPGSKFYEELDAQTFADWGVDSLKLDGCYSTIDDYAIGYPLMEFWLNKTGRPILYSCSWPAYVVFSHKIPDYAAIAKSCNIWRNYGDIQDSWGSVTDIIRFYGNDSGNFSSFAGPGNFNDPDMIIVGDYGLSFDQQQVQMALWAIMASPLLMSNDLRIIRAESKAILQNKMAISINQDPLGIQGKRVYMNNKFEIWTRPLKDSRFAIAAVYYGTGGGPTRQMTSLGKIGLTNQNGYTLTDVFTGQPAGKYSLNTTLTLRPNPSGVLFFLAVPQ
ncbi:alpha-N-acetylgalactosaminidase-like isoform X2 [Gigantopelta aegis]|uniref:alpha-N-acetylgalactosaminidase-like isoform X2 n=1 Tax=Gigantopelta aegis TaxID=1735272 RepID=UPI001B88BC91|nr:alpha-N-acetylgalactosaminidase-like isoform X2 [Gigantopelta aegis]